MKRLLAVMMIVTMLLGCMGVASFAEGETPVERPVITNSPLVILYEESTDTLMYEKRIDSTNAPASMTKVMTAVLVLEYDPELKGSTTVSADAISDKYCYWMNYNHLLAGEELTVWDLMNYLLIPSGNEAGTVLAEYVAGDIPTFIDMMNAKAKELGMTRTHYEDPHGLSEENKITCEDMLKLCRYAMTFENFRKIVSTKQGNLPENEIRPYPIRYSTTNRVMNPRGQSRYDTGFTEDIIGIKTGYIRVAGNNLACCMVHGDLTFYSVVMHAHDEQQPDGTWLEGHYMDTRELMVWARSFQKFGYAAGDEVTTVERGMHASEIRLLAKDDIYALGQTGVDEKVELNKIPLRVKAGDVLGKLTVSDEFGNVRETELVAAEDVFVGPILYVIPCIAVALVILAAALIARSHKKAKN